MTARLYPRHGWDQDVVVPCNAAACEATEHPWTWDYWSVVWNDDGTCRKAGCRAALYKQCGPERKLASVLRLRVAQGTCALGISEWCTGEQIAEGGIYDTSQLGAWDAVNGDHKAHTPHAFAHLGVARQEELVAAGVFHFVCHPCHAVKTAEERAASNSARTRVGR